MRLTYYSEVPQTNIKKVHGASKQSTISGWGKHDVRISVPFTPDTTRAHKYRNYAGLLHHVFGTLIG